MAPTTKASALNCYIISQIWFSSPFPIYLHLFNLFPPQYTLSFIHFSFLFHPLCASWMRCWTSSHLWCFQLPYLTFLHLLLTTPILYFIFLLLPSTLPLISYHFSFSLHDLPLFLISPLSSIFSSSPSSSFLCPPFPNVYLCLPLQRSSPPRMGVICDKDLINARKCLEKLIALIFHIHSFAE